jgi:hypothetical protein
MLDFSAQKASNVDAHQLSLAKTLTDSEINNLAAAVSAAFCYNS